MARRRGNFRRQPCALNEDQSFAAFTFYAFGTQHSVHAATGVRRRHVLRHCGRFLGRFKRKTLRRGSRRTTVKHGARSQDEQLAADILLSAVQCRLVFSPHEISTLLQPENLCDDLKALIVALEQLGAPEAFTSTLAIVAMRHPSLSRWLRFLKLFAGEREQCKARARAGHTAANFDILNGPRRDIEDDVGSLAVSGPFPKRHRYIL